MDVQYPLFLGVGLIVHFDKGMEWKKRKRMIYRGDHAHTMFIRINLKNTQSHVSIDPIGIFLFQENLFIFLSNLYIPPCLGKLFKFTVFIEITGKFTC